MISSAFISRCPIRYILKKSSFIKMAAQHFQVPQAKSEIKYGLINLTQNTCDLKSGNPRGRVRQWWILVTVARVELMSGT